MDVITDFNRREGDHIDVRAIDANPIVPRNQDFTFMSSRRGARSVTSPTAPIRSSP